MWKEEAKKTEEHLRERIIEIATEEYRKKEALAGAETLRRFEKDIMLQTLDELWKEHLSAMDYLRQGIHLRGYAQKDPKQEYKRESFEMFTNMLDALKLNVIRILSRVQVRSAEEVDQVEQAYQEKAQRQAKAMEYNGQTEVTNEDVAMAESERKIGRNEPCPCGSGKKYKHCHGNRANY